MVRQKQTIGFLTVRIAHVEPTARRILQLNDERNDSGSTRPSRPPFFDVPPPPSAVPPGNNFPRPGVIREDEPMWGVVRSRRVRDDRASAEDVGVGMATTQEVAGWMRDQVEAQGR